MPETSDPLLQSWLEVYRALDRLEREPATIGTFREVHAVPAWEFAVQARGPDAEQRQHKGPSPWIAFARDKPAHRIRELLPIWIGYRQLRAIPLEELAREVERDPLLRRRAAIGVALMTHLVAHPDDWRWMLGLFNELHARPLLRADDEYAGGNDNELEGAFGGPPPRVRRRPVVSESPADPVPNPILPPRPSTRPVPGWRRPAP
jgi:hypothetical protein